VTSIDLDHQDYLGDTRESIGFEKAGVYRKAIPAICGDANPPTTLIKHAEKIQANFKQIHQDFDYAVVENGWQYLQHGKLVHTLPKPALQGAYQLANAACVIAAVESLQSRLPVSTTAMADAMQRVTLAGRFQVLAKTKLNTPRVIVDVAHNPHAAQALADNLKASKAQYTQTNTAKTFAVFAMLADKDMQGVVNALKSEVDVWYVASINHSRGAQAADLAKVVLSVLPLAKIKQFDNASNAYQQACIDMGENDKMIVFGSFFTVASVLQVISAVDISE
jgi:dihydrofolate synthase/folylpolyglutamate synthase